MDLIHSLSNLAIETHHPHASSSKEEDEMTRNWLELSEDVMSLIFQKLGHVDILVSAQLVCTSWWKLSKQPQVFRCIHVEEILTLFGHSVWLYTTFDFSRGFAREAIDRSCGQLVEFPTKDIADDELLNYMSEKSSSLRCLRLLNRGDNVTGDGLVEIAEKLPQLEELEIVDFSYFSQYVLETFGRFCPQLKSCRLIDLGNNYLPGTEVDDLALAIAENMPELRHLNLFGNSLTDDGLKAVLNGCPHLESLDLRQCFALEFAGDLNERCKNIRVLRLPKDPTDDFEYKRNDNPTHDEDGTSYSTDYGMNTDDEICESDVDSDGNEKLPFDFCNYGYFAI